MEHFVDIWFLWRGVINYDLVSGSSKEIFRVGQGVTAGAQNWHALSTLGGCAHKQECPVHAMSHSAEGSMSEKIRSKCFNMVVWIWKHPKHQAISEMMTLMGKDLSCSAWTKEHLWTSVGLRVLHRKIEMKNRILLQIHIKLSFHLSPWEHKGVYSVLSGICDPVNNNSWMCWGWCQLLDRLLWQPEPLLSKWSCAPCGWSAGHSGLQGKTVHGESWSSVRTSLFCEAFPPCMPGW